MVVNGAGAAVHAHGDLYPVRAEASDDGNPSRGLFDLAVYVDRAVSTGGDGVCPEALSP